MFSCKDCGKSYSTQNSLTRHTYNHRKSKQYACSVCDVIFYRRDLLSRHMGMHRDDNAKLPCHESSLTSDQPNLTRRRCHTACTRCRESRTRCNGQLPCLTCTKAGKSCEYKRKSSRVSDGPVSREVVRSLSNEEHNANRQAPRDSDSLTQLDSLVIPQDSNSNDFSQVLDGPSNQITYTPPVTSYGTVPDTIMEEPVFDELNLSWMDNIGGNTAWPWLHESLFLQSDPMSSWISNMSKNLAAGGENGIGDGPQFLAVADPVISHKELSTHLPADLATHGHQTILPVKSTTNYTSFLDFGQSSQTNAVSERPFYSNNTEPQDQESGMLANKQDVDIPVPVPSSLTLAPKDRDDKITAQIQVVNELVTSASALPWPPESASDRTSYWRSMSHKIEKEFELDCLPDDAPPHLEQFVNLYLEHFGPLWPLLSRQSLDTNCIHPLLYLTLTSIGGMYGGISQSLFGGIMHKRIRKCLTAALELEESDDDFIWLAQARLLTQVGALYFGQAKAFSYAQHIGALLVAQARRMNLFSVAANDNNTNRVYGAATPRSDAERLARWVQLEARRRLAFGILRGDMYTSILLNICPLVSLEEFDLQLPGCDSVWRGERMPPEVCLRIIEQDRTMGRQLRFSDIYHIALDQNEPLPALEPEGNELLLFGLQQPIWKFSRNPHIFLRLTGEEKDYSNIEAQGFPTNQNGSPPPLKSTQETSRSARYSDIGDEVDHIDGPLRQMIDLKRGYDRVVFALAKWKRSLTLVKAFVHSDKDRHSLLSSLILYHLSYLRLHAPIGDLHQVSYQLADGRPIEDSLIKSVSDWAATEHANLAARHATSIWSLVTRETQRPEKVRAKFNLIGFTGLHHAAVVLWSYVGARNISSGGLTDQCLALDYPDNPQPGIPIARNNAPQLLMSFVRLYERISSGRWSSFATAAMKLSEHQFPIAG